MASADEIRIKIIKFTLDLYGNNLIPRNVVQKVIDYIQEFIRDILIPSLDQQISSLLENKCNINIVNDVKATLNYSKKLFEPVSSEHLRFALYRRMGCFITPEKFVIGQANVERTSEDGLVYVNNEDVYAIHMPLAPKLTLFFQIPGVFSQVVNNMTMLRKEKKILANIVQGSLWENLSASHENKLFLPMNIFYDDLETKNPLGSHAGRNKIGVTYATIPCLPTHIVSRLDSIFLATLFYSNDRKIFTNKRIFKKLLDDIKLLQTDGIEIIVDNVKRKIYFECTLILGDNLGLNGVLGFVESFSAHYPCRMCCMKNSVLQKAIIEDKQLLRTVENYEEDIETNDVSLTGIKEKCIFNQENHFHVCKNESVDIMHDVFEGSGNYSMSMILYRLIFIDSLLTYDILVNRMETFQYGLLETSNKPPVMKLENISNKNMLKMSASEMTCFIRYFGLMIGDLIPRNNSVWKLYLKLRQIVDIITAPKLLRDHAIVLDDLVKEYNTLYIEFVGPLTIKSHNMTHYGRLMLQNGPLVHCWSMRCESRNREIKAIANATCCTKNLLYTIAVKDQLKMTSTIISSDFSNNISFGPKKQGDYSEIKKTYFPATVDYDFECYKHISISGQKYQKNTVVFVDVTDNNDPLFGKIDEIFSVNGKLSFLMYSMQSKFFDEHYHAFCVCISSESNMMKEINTLPDVVPCLLVKKKEEYYVATRHLI
ncbi:uncharacterized protein LOC130669045 [Microplitis mediator]|uniref:uncharacterized protein LOC130669045 n=1 Tax=Microplitis mediator TaxID=375433 RepID=UPI002554A78D|nr:uncharacterized protein LOC130669045 [Microplitis mediator]